MKERENAKKESKRRKKQIGMYNRSYQNYVLPISGIKTAGVKGSIRIIISAIHQWTFESSMTFQATLCVIIVDCAMI